MRRHFPLILAACTLLSLWVLPQPAFAGVEGPRHAILIGNADYEAGLELPNPVNDVRTVADVLSELGFTIHLLENGTLEGMRSHIRRAVDNIPDDSLLMFYFAGHAIQKNGVNRLLPVDIAISDSANIEDASAGIDEIIREINAIEDVTKVIVLDACRNYPIGDESEVLGNGLAEVFSSGETLVAYATLAGEVAADGTGPNSPYTGALVSALDIKGLELNDVFRTVRYKVRSATDGLQLPWVSGLVSEPIILNPTTSEETPQELAQLKDLDPVQAVHWRSIYRSNDPGEFRAFASIHNDSPVRALAEERERLLQSAPNRTAPPVLVADEHPDGAPFTVTACDKWASDPLDPKRVSAGVPWGLVNTRNAIRDCSIALSRDPDSPRLSFLLARALDISESFDEARIFYERAAAGGYGVAHRNLGYMYRNARGVAPNDAFAAQHYFAASFDGIVDARKALAKLYEEGWGVEQSYPEMLRWLELSAEEDYPNSLDHLGNLYRTGEYVEQDYQKAIDYYERGAALDYGNAISNLARMYRDGLGVDVDRARAMNLYERAVEVGNAFAPYHLARMLLSPEGDEIEDTERAHDLLELSAERGYVWALWQLARSWNNGSFGPKDIEKAAFYLWIAAEAGRSMRTNDGEQIVSDATELLKEVEPQLTQAERAEVERNTQQWLKQNSLFGFSLIFPY